MKRQMLPPQMRRRIGQALHDYAMLEDGDRVLLAVSGGVDSLVLAWTLRHWQAKAPISYSLHAVTVDHGFWRDHPQGVDPHISIGRQLQQMGVDHSVEPAWELAADARSCYQCARNRRSQLFELARQRDYTKVALGHHRDDLIETFLLNILYSGNISTMVPKQVLFAGRLSLIRPLAYLDKEEVMDLAAELHLQPVANLCPLAEDTRRETVRQLLAILYERQPQARQSLFAALGNVRHDYLLHPVTPGSGG